MKAIVNDFFVNIFPTDLEVISECKIGKGKDTCIFLVMGAEKGWECTRMDFKQNMQILARHEAGAMNAGREGCERVNNWNPAGIPVGTEVEIP